MNVTVYGLGYVGCVTSACLAELGHDVVGVDVDEMKVSLINNGTSPIIEPGLSELLEREVASGRLRATTSLDVLGDLVMVAVGTPSNNNGSLGLDQLSRVLLDIAALLGSSENYVVINIRSTVLPGTVENTVIPILEKGSGRKCGRDFGVSMNPEFLRETTAVKDFADPPFTVVGANERRAGERVAALYAKLNAPVEFTSLREAEMVKYACNAFHAMKVCFANEIGNVSKKVGIDSHRVMDILCMDDKLNLSSYYLKPGFAFGGSCLPKDLRAILHKARQLDVDLPVLGSLLASNEKQIDVAFNMISGAGKKRIGILGLSFKAGTDDLRESPIVALVERLIGKGYDLKIYDEEVALAKLFGANRRYIEQTIPHISSLMTESLEETIAGSDVIVVSKNRPDFVQAINSLSDGPLVIDLVRLNSNLDRNPNNYEGISW